MLQSAVQDVDDGFFACFLQIELERWIERLYLKIMMYLL